jgi:LPS-assembly protein|tara:strand:+ start:473 stop:2938 length:2466 start_codon:yes stop_codon:yes gene_type:complete
MKNKFIKILLTFVLSLSFVGLTIADEFIFEVSEIEVTNNGNTYRGINKGKIITENKIEITSDNFEYLKEINQLEAYGNAQIFDPTNDIKINAKKIFYLKNKEIIYTVGKTLVKISTKYNIEGYDLKFFRNKMILSSLKKAVIKDNLNNVYRLDEFEYAINEEILKGKKIQVITNIEKLDSDKYFFEDGFFDLKSNKFLAKDVNILFHKTLFNEDKNDPRLKAVTGYGDKFNTYLEKGVFTSCKNTDKCPPWKITSKKIKHDKKKKRIVYKDAWLQVYDVPVMYFPKFFHPDPSVSRQSGFLNPELGSSTSLGDSIYTPYFFAISESKDITIKPRLFNYNKFVIQNEYRQKTKNSNFIADFSITKGHNSSLSDKKDSRSHFFANSKTNLNLDEFLRSSLEINFEKTSNDNYLKLFNLESPLLIGNTDVLESKIELDLEHPDFDFTTTIAMYETLDGPNSDRYQYVFPSYNFTKNFGLENINGSFNFNSTGNNSLKSTNELSTIATNNLNYESYYNFFENGIKSKFAILLKNPNTVGKKSSVYESSLKSEITSAYVFNASLPLIKDTKKNSNLLEPKISFRFNPHKMKNNKDADTRIDINNIFNNDRMGIGDTFEGGESVTLGLDYKIRNVKTLKKDNIREIEDFLEFKLATVLRRDEDKNIPIKSTLHEKRSNIFGQVNYKPSNLLSLNYNFSLKNDLSDLEYNSIDAIFKYNKFSSRFDYIEEKGRIGNVNVIENRSSYNFNEENVLSFKTRRNRELNLTEYYNMIYEYKNDCLVASLDYKRKYYNDSDIKPSEELFFTITIIPFTTFQTESFSPDKLILK